VNLVSSGKSIAKTKSLIELCIGAITLLRASHPSHVALIIKENGAVELADDIWMVVMLEGCYLNNTQLLQALINEVKIILNVIVQVRHVECMLMHIPTSLEV
jgi:hypothetical protein